MQWAKASRALVAQILGAVATPLAAEMTFRPPTPSKLFPVVTLLIAEAMIVALSVIGFNSSSLRKRGIAMLMWTIVFFLAAVAYQSLWSGFVVVFSNDSESPIVTGYSLLPNIEQLVAEDQELNTRAALLEHFERKPATVWTEESRSVVQNALFASWLAYWLAPFGALTAFLSGFSLAAFAKAD